MRSFPKTRQLVNNQTTTGICFQREGSAIRAAILDRGSNLIDIRSAPTHIHYRTLHCVDTSN